MTRWVSKSTINLQYLEPIDYHHKNTFQSHMLVKHFYVLEDGCKDIERDFWRIMCKVLEVVQLLW